MECSRVKLSRDKVFWSALAIGSALMLVFLFCFTLITSDSATYYTRMAREFAAGNYSHAFYPIIPPLIIVLGGTFAKLGLSAFFAVKLVLSVFFIAGMFVLRSLMQRILPGNLASWACLVYAISFYLVKHVAWGEPFALKMFFLLLSTYLIIKFAEKQKFVFALLLGVSLGLLALARGECIMLLPLFLAWFIVLPFFSYYKIISGVKKNWVIIRKLIVSIIIVLVTFVVICLPQIMYMYKNTGIPFTEQRTAEFLAAKIKQVTGYNIKQEFESAVAAKAKGELVKKARRTIGPLKLKPSIKKQTLLSSVLEAIKGLYHFFILFIILGLFWKFKNRKFYVLDFFYGSIFIYNAAMFIFTTGVTEYRYTAVAQPFVLGWVALGGYYIYSWRLLSADWWNKIMKIALVVVFIGLLMDTTTYLRKQWINGNPGLVVGKWIDNHRSEFPSTKRIANYNNYYNNRLPVIASIDPYCAYWAKGDLVQFNFGYIYPYADIVNFMKNCNATVLIDDSVLRGSCPSFRSHYKKDFKIVKDFKNLGIRVLQLK